MKTVEFALRKLMDADGAKACCAVDASTQQAIASHGLSETGALQRTAEHCAKLVGSQCAALRAIDAADTLEDVLIHHDGDYVLVRPVGSAGDLILCLILDKNDANLILARRQLAVAGEYLAA